MVAPAFLKRAAISCGVYRSARWLKRRVSPGELRQFEAWVAFYRRLLPDKSLCFDIGANIGEISEALLQADVGSVVAFEPNPLVLPELRARCGCWDNWTDVHTALGSAPAITTLYARRSHVQSGLLADWEGETMQTMDVPVVTLDVAIDHFGQPHYCKVDVEGWELEVLRGLSHPLSLISFEYHLSESDVDRALACLDLIGRLASYEVNFVGAEGASLLLAEWMSLDRAMDWFPGNLADSPSGRAYGDIFVRRSDTP